MVSSKTLKVIEYDKILSALSDFAVLEKTKAEILEFTPTTDFSNAKFLLQKTVEAYKLLYTYSVNGVYFFDDISDELVRVEIGSTLRPGELLKVLGNLRGARILKSGILAVNDYEITIIPEIARRIYTDNALEKTIAEIIISEDEISDNASPKLASIRREIRRLNVKIRDQLNAYMRGSMGNYLQENIVTMRQDRYVIPVKSKYRSSVKGFIHDQSASGSTVFIEPEQVMEANNELKRALLDEKNEINRILKELTERVKGISGFLKYNIENTVEIDNCFARAIYSYSNKCSLPILNNNGIIDIKRGRHPLINKDAVVPVNVAFGEKFNFLLITGPNTGGKTVTMKLVGLFSLMACSGLYILADDESKISIFSNIFCDIGDEQSIEQNLSTFSSHINNIKEIIDNVDEKSLVLLDEVGAGTNPEEGSALALAITEELLNRNCFGIITTHYSALKVFASDDKRIENASMEFDADTLKPMYKLNVGTPGSSNAIDIAKTLGLNSVVIENALKYITDDQINFEKVIKDAENSRRIAEKLKNEYEILLKDKKSELDEIHLEKEKIVAEREKIFSEAKQEVKRIVLDRSYEAEEIISELKKILKEVNLESKAVFRASALKNKLNDSRYLTEDFSVGPQELNAVNVSLLKPGTKVYVKSLNGYGIVNSVKTSKKEAEILFGDAKIIVKIKDLFNAQKLENKNENVKIYKNVNRNDIVSELNVIGFDSTQAIIEVENFIDRAVINNLETIRIIHGIGEGILLKSIREYLKKNKNVKEFRRGMYGEGENGVTVVTLK